MKTSQWEYQARTLEPLDVVDLTDEIDGALGSSGIENGQVTVFCPHTACSLVVNERESGLLSDTRAAVTRLRQAPGGPSHMIGSASIVLPAVGGRLRLGSWQRVLLFEWQRGADRQIVVQIVGE